MSRGSSSRWATPERYPRTARLNELLREVIADALEKDSDDDSRLDLVTVTGVEVAKDLAHATVYVSALDTNASPEEVIAALDEKRIGLQKTIGKDVRMKRTPHLFFRLDQGILEGQRIEGILRGLNQSEQA